MVLQIFIMTRSPQKNECFHVKWIKKTEPGYSTRLLMKVLNIVILESLFEYRIMFSAPVILHLLSFLPILWPLV